MDNITQIPAPRVPVIDERTGLMSREWFMFLSNIFFLTGSGASDTTIPEVMAIVNTIKREGGRSGADGVDGEDGERGFPGPQGVQGERGLFIPGMDGQDGEDFGAMPMPVKAPDSYRLEGATWAAPGTIGSGTPNSGAFTTIASSSTITAIGSTVRGYMKTSSTTVVGSAGVTEQFAVGNSQTFTFTLTGGQHGSVMLFTDSLSHSTALVLVSWASATPIIISQTGTNYAVTATPSAAQIGISKSANSYVVTVKTGSSAAGNIGVTLLASSAASTTDPA